MNKKQGFKAIKNKRAYHDYEILETLEVGIVLKGSEVKSIRNRQIYLRDSYVRVENEELWLWNAKIPQYRYSQDDEYKEDRRRKLLASKRQIKYLERKVNIAGVTIVPLKAYQVRGRFKLEVGLVRGRKQYEKRRRQKERDLERDLHRKKRKFIG